MALTDIKVKAAKPGEKPIHLKDKNGLYLEVAPTGGKRWRIRYAFGGKDKRLSLGTYPAISLAEARERRDEIRTLIAKGIDPSLKRKVEKKLKLTTQGNTLRAIATEWLEDRRRVWSDGHYKRNEMLLRLYVFPELGNRPIADIDAPELLAELKKPQASSKVETAHKTLQVCNQIFRYAIVTGRADRNPAVDIRGALIPVKKQNFARLKDTREIANLLRDIDAYNGTPTVHMALRLMPYVFLRSKELREGKWSEIDFENRIWRIPAQRMKRDKDHVVPLSEQSMAILRQLNEISGSGDLMFPSAMSKTRVISDMALLNGLRRMGYDKSQMTIHGFRGIASTLLNEFGYDMHWIERQLAHTDKNSVRAAYNHADYLPQRAKMMQEWADYLDKLRN